MAQDPQAIRRAAAARDLASVRVRRLTGLAVAGAAALTGIFAALAAGSTPPKKAPVLSQPARGAAKEPAGPVQAPAPPLVSARGESPASPAPPTQAPAPAPATAAPVVVSGGS